MTKRVLDEARELYGEDSEKMAEVRAFLSQFGIHSDS
jgi:hypothetical protein